MTQSEINELKRLISNNIILLNKIEYLVNQSIVTINNQQVLDDKLNKIIDLLQNHNRPV